MKTKVTQDDIKILVMEIFHWLQKYDMADDLYIYSGHERLVSNHKGVYVEQNKEAKDYCGYAPYHNIITIASEGMLCDYYNYHYELPARLNQIWEKYGLYYECNESWNWSLYPESDDVEVEYPEREPEPAKPTYIFLGCRERLNTINYPKELDTIMQLWYDLGQTIGDKGSCVIGQKMKFHYKDVDYEMCPCTGFQGEYSWSAWVDTIKDLLQKLGATGIKWNCGILD